MNDGSTDDTLHICETLAASDSRIIVINQENLGMGSARNHALDIARGKYISFIDSDDTISYDFYDNISILDNDETIDFVRMPILFLDGDGKILKKEDEEEGMITDKKEMYRRWLSNMLGGVRGYVWQGIFRREVFDTIRFAPIVYEDCYIMADIINVCHKVCLSKNGAYYYYRREGSITNTGWTINKIYGDMEATTHYLEKSFPYISNNAKYHLSMERFISRAFTVQRSYKGFGWNKYYHRLQKITSPY